MIRRCVKGAEEEEEKKQNPRVKKTRDHGLEFRLFNTMLAEC